MLYMLLDAHEALRAKLGPLRSKTPGSAKLEAAVAELQDRLAKTDKTFTPKNDLRVDAGKPTV